MTLKANGIVAAATAAALFAGASTPARAALFDCDDFGTVVSQNSDSLVIVNFHNATTEPRQLKWIDENGMAVDSVTIQPDRRVGQPVNVGHVWMIADEAGECLYLYSAETSETLEISF